MFSFTRFILLGMLSMSFAVFADDAVPHQIYREALDPNAPVAAPAAPSASTTSAVPAPAPSGSAASPTPLTGSVNVKPTATPSNATVPSVAPAMPSMPNTPSMMPSNGKSPTAAANNDANIQQQIDLINQNNVLFAQTINTKIEALNSQLVDLQNRVQQLSQAMLLLNQEMRQKSASSVSARSPGSVFARYTWFDYLFWLAVIVLGMILLSFFRRSARPAATPVKQAPAVSPASAAKPAPAAKPAAAATVEPQKPPAEDLEGDYDYLGSSESIPAKLNLARAYIAMGNHVEAQQVLKEVLASGDNKQCMEAEALLKKIPSA